MASIASVSSVSDAIQSESDATDASKSSTTTTDIIDTATPTSDIGVISSTDATVTPKSASEQPSESTMAEHHYRYKVQMTCGGCSGAVTRVLTKAKESGAGVTDFTVSLENQLVEVHGPIEFETLTEKIQKTGKKILEKEEVTEAATEETPAAQVEATSQPVAVA